MSNTVSTEDIKSLRESTGVSIALCKSALEEAGGDMTRALAVLQAKSAVALEKKAGRTLGAGTVATYVHGNKTIGAMVLLMCETDFVAKNEEFATLAHDIAMHISAMSPADIESLLEDDYVKDPSKKIKHLIESAVQKFGERILIANFARYSTAN